MDKTLFKDYQLFLFDLDGTLVDTKNMIYICFKKVLEKFFSINVTREEVYKFVGLPYRDQLELYTGKLTDKKFEEVLVFHKAHQSAIAHDYICLTPGAKKLIDFLKGENKKLGVVTNRLIASTRDYLEHLGVYHNFDFCITPDIVVNPKPDPESIFLALKKASCSCEKTLFVGDSVYDILAGNRANVKTVFTDWDGSGYNFSDGKPDFFVNDLAQIIWH